MFSNCSRVLAGTLLIGAAALASSASLAAEDVTVLREELDALKQQMEEMQRTYQQRIELLEQRIQSVESEPAEEPVVVAPPPPYPLGEISAAPAGTGFQIGADVLMAGGGSSVGDDEVANLHAGGHDPKENGFTFQNFELVVGGAVDPYFDAQANLIVLIDQEGETVVELEEAYATTRSLPWGLQVKAGQYFTDFGRQNPQHPHVWDFTDQPVILSRLFGADNLRSQGAQVAWLTPLPWYSELLFGAQNARGETVVSFLGEEGQSIGGAEFLGRQSRNFSDLLYLARWLNGLDLSDETSVNWGVSGLYGPNATGTSTSTYILGSDLYMKWQPPYTVRGFPFLSWQTEALWRRFEAGFADAPVVDLSDWGFYTQGLWGFSPGWVAGLRVGHANADGDTRNDPLRDTRWRVSPNLTWYPTEFSRLRLQYNRDWAEFLADGSADSVWLQLEVSLGSHFAHKF
jgi:hypothetical protein